MAPSQEDEWKWMVDQDPHSGSVAGDSGHGTMAATGEDEPIDMKFLLLSMWAGEQIKGKYQNGCHKLE